MQRPPSVENINPKSLERKATLNKDEIDNLRETFNGIDKDGNGFIEKEEMMKMLEPFNMPQEGIEALF